MVARVWVVASSGNGKRPRAYHLDVRCARLRPGVKVLDQGREVAQARGLRACRDCAPARSSFARRAVGRLEGEGVPG